MSSIEPSRSHQVILQIGSRFIQAGLGGNPRPSCVKNTNDTTYNAFNMTSFSGSLKKNHFLNETVDPDQVTRVYQDDTRARKWLWEYDLLSIENLEDYNYSTETLLEQIVYRIFREDLLVDAPKCHVIVPEPVLMPIFVKECVTKVLLRQVHANSISFVPEPLMAVLGGGVRNGIVIDIGWESLTITPVFDMRILHKSIKTSSKAGKMLHYSVVSAFQSSGVDIKTLTFEWVEDFVMNYVYCRTRDMLDNTIGVETEFEGVNVPGSFRFEIVENFLFTKDTQFDIEEQALTQLIVQLLGELPIDVRKDLYTHIIFTGGVSKIIGLKTRIIEELRLVLDTPVAAIKSIDVWSGTSLYASSKLKTSKINSLSSSATIAHQPHLSKTQELTRERYLKTGARANDWLDQLQTNVISRKVQ